MNFIGTHGFKKNDFIYTMLLIYPAINVLIAYLYSGDMMNTFSFLFSFFIIALICNGKIKKTDIIIFAFALIIPIIGILREERDTAYFSLQFFDLVITFIFYSEFYINKDEFSDFVFKNRKLIHLAYIFIYYLLFLSFQKYGFNNVRIWNTAVFRGPYRLPHTLAYILLFISLLNIFLFKKTKKIFELVFVLINFIIILLTAVRSAIISMLFIAILLFDNIYNNTIKRNKILYIIIISLFFAVIYKNRIFDFVIKKTQSAIAGGDITNSRGKIFLYSTMALFETDTNFSHNLLIGIGMDKLMRYNFSHIYYFVHGHNDFIDALTCYGVIGASIYSISLSKFCKRSTIHKILFLFPLIFWNGLFPYGEITPIIVYIRVLFENKTEKSRLKEGERYKE